MVCNCWLASTAIALIGEGIGIDPLPGVREWDGAIAPVHVHRHVVRDREEPAAERAVSGALPGARCIAGKCRDRLGEGLAGGVFRRFLVFQQPVAEPVDGQDVAIVERREGGAVVLRACDEHRIFLPLRHGSPHQ